MSSSDKTTVNTKRRSVLSEAGVKPSIESLSNTKSTTKTLTSTTPPSSTLTRKSSIKPSSSSASKVSAIASTFNQTTTRTKTPPSTIKVDRSLSNASSSLKSPVSTNPKPKSLNATASPKSSISPLARRSSVNSGSSSVNKQASAASTLSSVSEVTSMKEKLDEKDNEIQKLKQMESESERKISDLEIELSKLKDELRLSSEYTEKVELQNNDLNNIKEQIVKETENKLEEKFKSEIQQRLKEKEILLEEKFTLEKTSLLEEQNKKLASKLVSLENKIIEEYEQRILTLKNDYEKHLADLKQGHEKSLSAENKLYSEKINTEKNIFEKEKQEKDAIIHSLTQQVQILEESQSNNNFRKLQNELESTLASFEEYKKTSQLEIEALERRYRDEIKQLQHGNDDTAEAWLEKTRSAQQEVSQLHDEILLNQQKYEKAIEELKEAHMEEIESLREICDEKESQLDAQSHQIENLLYQVETLQNTLEAATVRLEHTAKSSPTNSSNKDDINNASNGKSVRSIHAECLNKLEVKQKEVDDLRSSLLDVKETYENQMNRLAQEKANTIQELKKKVSSLEKELESTATPPQSPIASSKTSTTSISEIDNDKKLIEISEKHRTELQKIKNEYQATIDIKNTELDDLVYRLKASMAAKQKEIEKLRSESNNTIDKYERDIKGYEDKLIEYNDESIILKGSIAQLELSIDNMKKGCAAHTDENAQLVKLVKQLQLEIHN